ncbi:carbon storage regulator CsrA [Paenibacillus gansuensis]|uniref:Translational regulator CsrA n=1 Tax=Paenibacillus gansuensis TaxID=306542 RepID=A0ABW5PJF6_9BACL
MLVLSRKNGESIMLGDEIEVTVLGVEGDAVKLGIKAPKNVGILRKELFETILLENKEAIGNQININNLKVLINFEKQRNDEEL